MVTNLRQAHQNAKLHIEEMVKYNQQYRKKHSVDKKIRVGDIIFLRDTTVPKGFSKKLMRKNHPYRVVEVKQNNVNLVIRDYYNTSGKEKVVHIDNVKKGVP